MMTLSELKRAMENWKNMDETEYTEVPDITTDTNETTDATIDTVADTSVTNEETLAVDPVEDTEEEVVAALQFIDDVEEATINDEIEEKIDETENLLHNLELMYHIQRVVERHGYNKVIAEMVNYDQIPGIRPGSFEQLIGVELPANESLGYDSRIDTYTDACLEGIKDTLSNIWKAIKEKVTSLISSINDAMSKTLKKLTSYQDAVEIQSDKIKNSTLNEEKYTTTKFSNIPTAEGFKKLYAALVDINRMNELPKLVEEIKSLKNEKDMSAAEKDKKLKEIAATIRKIYNAVNKHSETIGIRIKIEEDKKRFEADPLSFDVEIKPFSPVFDFDKRTLAEAGLNAKFLTDTSMTKKLVELYRVNKLRSILKSILNFFLLITVPTYWLAKKLRTLYDIVVRPLKVLGKYLNLVCETFLHNFARAQKYYLKCTF